jgi:hypothetical protein
MNRVGRGQSSALEIKCFIFWGFLAFLDKQSFVSISASKESMLFVVSKSLCTEIHSLPFLLPRGWCHSPVVRMSSKVSQGGRRRKASKQRNTYEALSFSFSSLTSLFLLSLNQLINHSLFSLTFSGSFSKQTRQNSTK